MVNNKLLIIILGIMILLIVGCTVDNSIIPQKQSAPTPEEINEVQNVLDKQKVSQENSGNQVSSSKAITEEQTNKNQLLEAEAAFPDTDTIPTEYSIEDDFFDEASGACMGDFCLLTVKNQYNRYPGYLLSKSRYYYKHGDYGESSWFAILSQKYDTINQAISAFNSAVNKIKDARGYTEISSKDNCFVYYKIEGLASATNYYSICNKNNLLIVFGGNIEDVKTMGLK